MFLLVFACATAVKQELGIQKEREKGGGETERERLSCGNGAQNGKERKGGGVTFFAWCFFLQLILF